MVRLKQEIRERAAKGDCILHENYKNPKHLGELLLDDLKAGIEADFPLLNCSYPANYIEKNSSMRQAFTIT
jgi:hypothetical protein